MGLRTELNPFQVNQHAIKDACRGVAQPGSASVLGTEGREFESLRPDHFQGNIAEYQWGDSIASQVVALASAYSADMAGQDIDCEHMDQTLHCIEKVRLPGWAAQETMRISKL